MKFLKHKQAAIFFFFTLSGTLFGQESLRVLYAVQPNFDLNKMQHAEAKTMAGMAADIMTDFEFQLLIDNDQSIFKQSKQLVRDDINPMMYELAAGFCSGNQIWHTKANDSIKRIALLNTDPSMVLTLDEKLQWEITNESKQIGNFAVLKATTTRRLGSYLEEIEAWFAPNLPYSFGPLGYSGLPGLILEMYRDNVIFKLKEIQEKKVEMKFPESSKEMTFEKYYDMLDANMAAIKKRGG